MDVTKASFAELRALNISRQLPRADLEQRIVAFLKTTNICVLCTAADGIPRATPIEYYSDGTTLYMTADEGTKTRNLRANPRVSVGISSVTYTDWTDWYRVLGVQITGQAQIVAGDEPEWADAMKIYRWQLYAKARHWDLSAPQTGASILKVTAQKVEYRELALMADGYSPTQVWDR